MIWKMIHILKFVLFIHFITFISASQATQSLNTQLSTRSQYKQGTKDITFCQIGRVDVCKDKTATFSDKSERLSYILELFVSHLKSYVSARSFDVKLFRENMGELKIELEEVLFEVTTNVNTEVTEKIDFTKHYLELMSMSTELLTHYSGFNAPGNRLLYKIIEINVRAHALCDSQGRLDCSDPEHASKIMEIYRNLYFWKDRFESVKGVRIGTRRVFDDEFHRAERAVKHLKNQRSIQENTILETRCKYMCERMSNDFDGGDLSEGASRFEKPNTL